MRYITLLFALFLTLATTSSAASPFVLTPADCEAICTQVLADGCPAVVCPQPPDCNVTCPAAVVCPTPDQIVDRIIERKVGATYVICKVRKDGTVKRCKPYRMIDALRSVTR